MPPDSIIEYESCKRTLISKRGDTPVLVLGFVGILEMDQIMYFLEFAVSLTISSGFAAAFRS